MEFFPLEFSASKISLNLWCLSNDTSVDIYINTEKRTIVLCLKACFYGLGLSNGDFFSGIHNLTVNWGGQGKPSICLMVSLAR